MNKIKIKVFDNTYKFIKYIINNNIYYTDLIKEKDCFILCINEKDYIKIKYRFKNIILKYYGKKGFINYLYFHRYMLISFVFSLIVLFMVSNTIFDIRINSNNKDIINIIGESLRKNNLAKYKKKKSFEEIQKIKEEILIENEEVLEWIEIKEKGCIYIIEVTPRVINKNKSNNGVSSIYSKSDGVIRHINVIRGTRIRDINDYVKRGDLLISGNIVKDEKLVSQVNAEGKIYAEVWYIITASIPFKYTEYEKTGKIVNHYYLDVLGNKFTITGKYDSDNMMSKTKLILDKPYLMFKLYKEVKEEYMYKEYSINEEEALNLALKRSEEKIKNKLSKDEYIISKKVLKKEVNYSKMYVEVFFKVYENIGVTSNIDIIGEADG